MRDDPDEVNATDDITMDSSPTESETAPLTRRGCLRGMMATAGAGTIASMSTNAGAETSSDRLQEYYEEFGTVIDVVEAGADNTGTESVVDVIREYRDDDTLLVFPPGEYYMDEQVRFTGFEKFGLFGNDATLVPANYHEFDGPQYRLFRLGVSYSPGDRLVFEGFDVDQTADDTGIRVLETVVDDGLEVRDITVHGEHDSGTWGPGRFAISDPAGSGLVERFEVPDGGAWEDETPNAGNIWRGPTGLIANSNEGTLEFADCVVGAFPDNGLYASGGTGTIVVDGGRFENSNAACVRIGGANSVVRDATVVTDQIRPQDEGQRGIRLENGSDLRVDNVTIENTAPLPGSHGVSVMNTCDSVRLDDIHVTVDGDEAAHGVVLSPECGDVTLVDSGIVMDTAGGFGIYIHEGDGAGEVLCEYLNVVGDASDESAAAGIRNDRDGTRFGAVSVDQPGGEDRRALVNTGDDVTVYLGDWLASDHPIIDLGTGTHVEDIYAKSYNDYEAICLYDVSADVYLKHNTLRGGIEDYGCEGLKTVGNEF